MPTNVTQNASPQTTYQDTGSLIRQVIEIPDLMSIAETPFLASIGGGTPDSPTLDSLDLEGGSMTTREIEWMEDELRPRVFTLGAAFADTSGTTMTVTPAAKALHLVKGLVLQLASGERVLVTTAGVIGGTAVVQRGFNSTTAATQSNGTTARVITRIGEEGKPVAADPIINPGYEKNFFQIFKESFSLSYAERGMMRYGQMSTYDRQVEKHTRQALLSLETGVLLNGAKIAQADGVPGQFGGVNAYFDSSLIIDNSAAALTRDNIDDLMNRQFGLVGSGMVSTDLWIDGTGYKELSELYSGGVMQVFREQSEQKAGIVIKQIETVHGLLNIHASPLMPANTIYAFRTDMLGVGPLKDNEFRSEELAKTGDFSQFMVYGAYTFQMRGRFCHGKIHNFTYS